MVCGRTKVFELEKVLTQVLGVDIKCRQSSDYKNALKKTKLMLDNDEPVLVYVDMPYLGYLQLDEDSHFGGHAIVIFGYDDEEEVFYVSDRDHSDFPIRSPKGMLSEDFHKVPYEQMERARSSVHHPFPAKNKYLQIDLSNCHDVDSDMILDSIRSTCEAMLQDKAKLLGLNGILKFSQEITKWAKFDDEKLKRTAIGNYFLISKDGGTGGGIFRRMYGDFLIESSGIVKALDLEAYGRDYHGIADRWDDVADLLYELHETGDRELLAKASDIIKDLHGRESALMHALQQSVQN